LGTAKPSGSVDVPDGCLATVSGCSTAKPVPDLGFTSGFLSRWRRRKTTKTTMMMAMIRMPATAPPMAAPAEEAAAAGGGTREADAVRLAVCVAVCVKVGRGVPVATPGALASSTDVCSPAASCDTGTPDVADSAVRKLANTVCTHTQ
jgi:hypothetical protein